MELVRKFTIKTMPVSTNALYAHVGRRRFLTPKARENKEAIGWEMRSQYHSPPLNCELKVSLAIYWPNKRKHDIDNIKGFLDALTGILYEDDSQICELNLSRSIDKENPRVEIVIKQPVLMEFPGC